MLQPLSLYPLTPLTTSTTGPPRTHNSYPRVIPSFPPAFSARFLPTSTSFALQHLHCPPPYPPISSLS
jgi:hypothetical protein